MDKGACQLDHGQVLVIQHRAWDRIVSFMYKRKTLLCPGQILLPRNEALGMEKGCLGNNV